MPEYLSDEWFDAAQAAIDLAPSVAAATADAQVVVQQVVRGGPGGDIEYHVVVDRGSITIARGRAREPEVTFEQDWATAAAVASGELSAQGAFMTGRMRVRGDLRKLLEHNDVFSAVGDVLASLRVGVSC